MSLFTAIRWQQRFVNLQRAFCLLEQSVAQGTYTELEKSGLIQQFEFCFELSWKTLKDYLANEGVIADTPRDVLKQAFSFQLFSNGSVWMDALEKRNLLSHVYDEETAFLAISLIREKYFPCIQELVAFFKTKTLSASYGLELSALLNLLEKFLRYQKIDAIILFGSRAMGNFKPTSDVDLCVKGPLSENEFSSLKTSLSEISLPYTIDLLYYETIKEKALIEHIDRFGKKLYPN